MMRLKQETIQRMKPFFSKFALQNAIEVIERKVNEREHILELGYFSYNGVYFYPSDFEDETTMKTEFKRGVDEIPEHYKKACATIEPRFLLKLMPFQLGNACKYALRCAYKGAEKQDLLKCLDYLEWAEEDNEKPFNDAVYYLAPFFGNDILDILFEENGVVDYNGAREFINAILDEIE